MCKSISTIVADRLSFCFCDINWMLKAASSFFSQDFITWINSNVRILSTSQKLIIDRNTIHSLNFIIWTLTVDVSICPEWGSLSAAADFFEWLKSVVWLVQFPLSSQYTNIERHFLLLFCLRYGTSLWLLVLYSVLHPVSGLYIQCLILALGTA